MVLILCIRHFCSNHFSDTSTPAKSNNDNFRPKRGKSNRMGNWQRFAAFNQEHQSPIPSPQRRTWNHDNLSKQNYHQRGKSNLLAAKSI